MPSSSPHNDEKSSLLAAASMEPRLMRSHDNGSLQGISLPGMGSAGRNVDGTDIHANNNANSNGYSNSKGYNNGNKINLNNAMLNFSKSMSGDDFTVSSVHSGKDGKPSEPWTLRRVALELSLYCNLCITMIKLVAYVRTLSLSVLAALLDSVLDVVSQVVLNYTEKHSSLQRSSAFYPAGASRLEPIGVLTCAALMGMASFEVLKESCTTLIYRTDTLEDLSWHQEIVSVWSMSAIVLVKMALLVLCQQASLQRHRKRHQAILRDAANDAASVGGSTITSYTTNHAVSGNAHANAAPANSNGAPINFSSRAGLQSADPTLEALAQDHWNDALSNSVAVVALLLALYSPSLWWIDPFGAIVISFYIIYSWYETGKEQIEQLTGKSAPQEFIEELLELAEHFDERILVVDTIRAYHFGPKFLVELEVVLPRHTLLEESHDLGMELQYEIEGREEVERCFVHMDYETRDYDEHVVSKVPELREQILRHRRHGSMHTSSVQTSCV